jgi:putative addiction module killer protein
VFERINRIRGGNFGVCKPIKGFAGLYEIVIDHGPGYRIYYGKVKSLLVILLVGGEKKTQKRDIEKAHHYWIGYKGSQP